MLHPAKPCPSGICFLYRKVKDKTSYGWGNRNSRILKYVLHTNTNQRKWFNPLNAELNPICHLLALIAHHILHVSRVRVNLCWDIRPMYSLSYRGLVMKTSLKGGGGVHIVWHKSRFVNWQHRFWNTRSGTCYLNKRYLIGTTLTQCYSFITQCTFEGTCKTVHTTQ
jgi:hypothetical protein